MDQKKKMIWKALEEETKKLTHRLGYYTKEKTQIHPFILEAGYWWAFHKNEINIHDNQETIHQTVKKHHEKKYL